MLTIAQQIISAGQCAAALAAGQHELTERQKLARQKAVATKIANGNGIYTSTGLKTALRQRLPRGEENAIALDEIRKLLTDITYSPNGLSAALNVLIRDGEAKRNGPRGMYRYYQ
jgi:hypothetical protein